MGKTLVIMGLHPIGTRNLDISNLSLERIKNGY